MKLKLKTTVSQATPLRFSPQTGVPLDDRYDRSAEYWRMGDDNRWLYNPWTGLARDPGDVESDPHGLGIDKGETKNTWRPWEAAHLPVPIETLVVVRHRSGSEHRGPAGVLWRVSNWMYSGLNPDIVAWRLLGENEGWVSRAPGAPHPVDGVVEWVNSAGNCQIAQADTLCWEGPSPVVRYRVMGEVEPELGDGWITWGGGKCPVPKGTLVDVKFRDGEELKGIQANVSQMGFAREAASSYWRHDDQNNDIVAYRVVPEPKHAPEFHVKASRTDEVLKVCKTLKKALKLMEIIHRAGGEAYIKEVAL